MQQNASGEPETRQVVPIENGRPVIAGAWRHVIGPVLGADGVLRVAVGADRGVSALDWWMIELKPGERAVARPMRAPDALIDSLLSGSSAEETPPAQAP
ncbi:MAG: hypothetical protein JNK53_03630 [Phycisphaerae bacterium]|nr:hypothetical protein [Phycisphaerae bacterium]